MTSLQLDEDSFSECCRRLLQKSEELRDGWSWERAPGTREGYLKKTLLRSVVTRSERNRESPEHEMAPDDQQVEPEHEMAPDDQQVEPEHEMALDDQQRTAAAPEEEEEEEEEDEGGEDDDAVATNCPLARCFQFEFHVVFSSSFGAPVLYFRAFTLEGKSLSLEEVWSLVAPKLRVSSQDALLDTVTQQEHPLLGQAFFMLHPCRTLDFMRPVLQAARRENRAVNFVLTWLSVVGPLLGLHLPLEYSSDP
ncbi:ubiquitin-like-conjugating enzyme ATG10 [Eucyclogobius newberryi]|uniref:ubiquitin-like-conjugating enzyme ATG10 n=1 Tax=Eucyclogobius newberryi TaxID=166745 RepID=UPI003B5973F6